jgi:hypothetical protein
MYRAVALNWFLTQAESGSLMLFALWKKPHYQKDPISDLGREIFMQKEKHQLLK